MRKKGGQWPPFCILPVEVRSARADTVRAPVAVRRTAGRQMVPVGILVLQ